jgi:hypothetical protein
MITKKKSINWINQTNRNKTNKARRINNKRGNWKFLKKTMKKYGKYLTKDFINKVSRNCNKRLIYLNFLIFIFLKVFEHIITLIKMSFL